MVMFLSSRRCDVDQIGKNLQCEQHRLNNPKVVGNMKKYIDYAPDWPYFLMVSCCFWAYIHYSRGLGLFFL